MISAGRLVIFSLTATTVRPLSLSLLLPSHTSRPRLYQHFLTMSQTDAPEHDSIVVESSAASRKGTILMLHGWAQNAAVMKMKTKTLTRKLCQAGYDCVFLEAPHVLPMTSLVTVEGVPVEVENGKRENARAWFVLSETDPADASLSQSGLPIKYIGLDESLAIVESELLRLSKSSDDFVSILGFSQGGVFAHILSRLAETSPEQFGRIRAVLVASGFAAQHVSDELSSYNVGRMSNRDTVSLPSLHMIGENDSSVTPDLSLDLAEIYSNSKVLMHEKGHMIPQKSALCAKVIGFLDDTCANFEA